MADPTFAQQLKDFRIMQFISNLEGNSIQNQAADGYVNRIGNN
jgi:hypothetical protein